MIRRTFATMFTLTLAALPVADVQADQQDYLFERVAASACQTRNSADRTKVTWTNGAWHLTAGELGPVEFECPIYTPWTDEDSGVRSPHTVRLHYRDSSGPTTGTSVKAQLMYLNPTSLFPFVIAILDSDSSANTGESSISESVPAMVDAQYFVGVTLVRASTGSTVSFRGISFMN